MELIAISDIYGDLGVVREMLERCGEQKLIVVAGDIGMTDQERFRVLSLLAESAEYVIYVPGDTDPKDMTINIPNIINLDRNNFFIDDDVRIGFIGLGGAPKHSIREGESLPNLYDESIQAVKDGIISSLKINLEKIMLNNPDYIVLVTHSPPYGVADKSTPVTLKEFIVLEEMLADVVSYDEGKLRFATTPRRLGSRAIKEFVNIYKPDIHIFGHIHKQGGKIEKHHDTIFFNVSHLSPVPYKLTGRKVLFIKFEEELRFEFDSIVIKDLNFGDFIERYI